MIQRELIMKNKIDINYNFTQDTPHYWDGFWDNDSILGGSDMTPIVRAKRFKSIKGYYGLNNYLMAKTWFLQKVV